MLSIGAVRCPPGRIALPRAGKGLGRLSRPQIVGKLRATVAGHMRI
jgi:hypothetical protein